MKKIFTGIILALLFVTPVFAQTWVNSSGTLSAAASVFQGEGNFHGIAIATDGTNAVTVSIYDNTTNSGRLLVPTFIASTSAADRTRSFVMSPPVRFNTGLYVDITCSGTVGYVVYFSR